MNKKKIVQTGLLATLPSDSTIYENIKEKSFIESTIETFTGLATWLNCPKQLNNALNAHFITSQKDGQNHKSTSIRRAFFHKCPSRQTDPFLDGRTCR